MAAIDGLFIDAVKWFEKRNAKVFVHGSTLLNIMRLGNIGPRPGVDTDREINIAILAEDFTDDLYVDLKEENRYFKAINNKMPNSGFFYARQPCQTGNHWEIRPGIVFLTRIWKGKTTRFKYHGKDSCILIPKRFVENKDKWTKLNVLGMTCYAPAMVEEYLTYYFGDWRKEDLNWHWSSSPNHISWEELRKRGEIPRRSTQ